MADNTTLPISQPISASADELSTEACVFQMLRRTWQPVALASALLPGGIVSYTLLNEEIVIARLPAGLLAARDLCPHRGAKFGLGQVVNGHLQCPYHGWEFSLTGACERIPSLIDPANSPKNACIQTFAVQQRYGMIWVRLDESELVPLPDVPEFEDTRWAYAVPPPMVFAAGFRREVENYLDMSHFAFAHKTTLGVAAADQITDITITHFDDGFQMDAPFPALDASESGVKPGKLQSTHHRRQRVYLPNFTTIRQRFTDGDERVLLHVPSPNTPTRCTVFWALAVSPSFAGPAVKQQVEFAVRVLDEDRIMVENQRPLEVPLGIEPDTVLVPADRLANTYKNALRQFILDSVSGPGQIAGANADSHVETITLLFASQTGNAENLAQRAARTLRQRGWEVLVKAMNEVVPSQLDGIVLLIAATTGDGDPPDNAVGFFDALHADQTSVTDLSRVRFAVLALGDRKYARFCRCGRDIDARLEQLGAQRLLTRVDCDGAYDAAFTAWSADVRRVLGKGIPQEYVALEGDDLPPGYSATKPLLAPVLENRRLSRLHSEKETRHYEVDVSGAQLSWEPGDALGVLPTNAPDLVDGVIDALGVSPKFVLADGRTLRTALLGSRELRRPGVALVAQIAQSVGDDSLLALASDPEKRPELDALLNGQDVYDLIARYPAARAIGPQRFFDLLSPLQPRIYSIASSPLASPGSIHLTVSTVRYRSGRRTHNGVASTYLADRVRSGERVPVFVRSNPQFRLPADDADLIMIGPGTGVAPFRAFLQHREATGARGRNWLFFGDQHRDTDYLYHDEISRWNNSGLLDRLDLAFSRDQEDRLYVQHCMIDAAEEMVKWLDAGAHLYVCGDAMRMARDVDETLRRIIATRKHYGDQQTDQYVRDLQRSGRYRKDVY